MLTQMQKNDLSCVKCKMVQLLHKIVLQFLIKWNMPQGRDPALQLGRSS